jgi:predicted nucleic acid-binding protein
MLLPLSDTNVMWRRFAPADASYSRVKAALDALILSGDSVYITSQNLVEFQSLATRPQNVNGLGFTPQQANEKAREMEAFFPLLLETPEIYLHWRNLMEKYEVSGRQVHDARLVAVMLAHNITHSLTMNPQHFRRFTEITVVEP